MPKKKGLSVAGASSFFISSLRSRFSFSSTFSSLLGSVFQSLLALLGYVIVEVQLLCCKCCCVIMSAFWCN